MTKIQKVWLGNVALVIVFYIIPLCLFRQYQQDFRNIENIQKAVFGSLFFGSSVLTYINYKNRVYFNEKKWAWVMFLIIGIAGIVYSSVIIYLLFVFRNGISF